MAFSADTAQQCIAGQGCAANLNPGCLAQEFTLRLAPPEEGQQRRFVGSFPLVRANLHACQMIHTTLAAFVLAPA